MKMNDLILKINELDILSLIVGSVISIVLTLFITNILPKIIKIIVLSFRNKYFSHEQILGNYYGYYLHKDNNKSEPILRESNWMISADYKKENYIVNIYHDNEKNKKKYISYKGRMWTQGDHYLLQFDSQDYKETIFERRIQITKAKDYEYPIVGISLAVTTIGKRVRANFSVLSRKKLSLDDFRNIIKEHKVVLEKETYNLKIEG